MMGKLASVAFALALMVACSHADLQLPPACSNANMGNLASLSFFAILAGTIMIAAAYMLGKALESPKITSWCKTEVWQVGASALIVVAIYASITLFCYMNPAAVLGMIAPNVGSGALGASNLTAAFGTSIEQNMYTSAQIYLEKLASYDRGAVSLIRYNIGVSELRASVQKYNCDLICFMTTAGESYSPQAGESVYVSLLSGTLNVATISLLSVLFQLFMLLYIKNGLFLVFLPIAIVIRSLPFMRGFGGAMIALVMALYILYPFMIYVNAVVVPNTAHELGLHMLNRIGGGMGGFNGISNILGPIDTVTAGGQSLDGEDSLVISNIAYWNNRQRDTGSAGSANIIMIGAVVFLASVFMPALNFVVIAAAAREIAKIIGDDLDISRLGQMV